MTDCTRQILVQDTGVLKLNIIWKKSGEKMALSDGEILLLQQISNYNGQYWSLKT